MPPMTLPRTMPTLPAGATTEAIVDAGVVAVTIVVDDARLSRYAASSVMSSPNVVPLPDFSVAALECVEARSSPSHDAEIVHPVPGRHHALADGDVGGRHGVEGAFAHVGIADGAHVVVPARRVDCAEVIRGTAAAGRRTMPRGRIRSAQLEGMAERPGTTTTTPPCRGGGGDGAAGRGDSLRSDEPTSVVVRPARGGGGAHGTDRRCPVGNRAGHADDVVD